MQLPILLAAGPDDTILFAIVVIAFPLFGAMVFFWWRRQYGVDPATRRSPGGRFARRRTRRDDGNVVYVHNPIFTGVAAAHIMGLQPPHPHGGKSNTQQDPDATRSDQQGHHGTHQHGDQPIDQGGDGPFTGEMSGESESSASGGGGGGGD